MQRCRDRFNHKIIIQIIVKVVGWQKLKITFNFNDFLSFSDGKIYHRGCIFYNYSVSCSLFFNFITPSTNFILSNISNTSLFILFPYLI